MNKHWRISLYGTDSDKRCSIGYHIELPKVKRTKNHSIFKKGKSTMPLIHVHMFSGRTPEQNAIWCALWQMLLYKPPVVLPMRLMWFWSMFSRATASGGQMFSEKAPDS